MRTEAYTVGYDRTNFQAPISEGCRRDEILKRREEEITNNILRYLGEYRLGVKFDEFFYGEGRDPFTNQSYLASSEPGPVRRKFRNAIQAREEKGLSVRREVAECLGFERLEQGLLGIPDNSLFIWVSPPGPAEDGYGLYSFTFVGQVIGDETSTTRVRVIPYRNILSKKEHRAYLSYFTKEAEQFVSDTDFLANPVIFPQAQNLRTPEDVLTFVGEYEEFNTEWFGKLAEKVGPLIQGYLTLVRRGASDEELCRALFAIENYTLAIRQSLLVNEGPISRTELEETIPYLFEKWGRFSPPPMAGSCGSTDSTLMEYHNTFNNSANESWSYHKGNCMICRTANVDVGPCNICKRCEKQF